MTNETSTTKRTLTGTVVSDKMTKTVVVAVTRLKMHAKYKKQYKVTTRYKAHDADEIAHTGDTVVIREAKPFSRDKRWEVVKKVEIKS